MNTAMKISTVGRHIREGSRSVFRNGWMSFASASAISISLFILGVFLMLGMNVNKWTKDVENQVEINVFLEGDVTVEQIERIKTEIGSIPEVSNWTFISKDEALTYLRERLGEDGQLLLEGFEGVDNPLPASFKVEVHRPIEVTVAADKIAALDNGYQIKRIWKIEYGKGTVEMLFKITNVIRNVGLVLVLGLAATAMFLISNTIKLTIVARRREIGIMKLVGATNGFIRWPFFIEGVLLGVIGSAIPVVILLIGYAELVEASRLNLGVMLIQMLPVREIGPQVAMLLIGIGLLIGVWGSTLSVRKFLKV